MTRATHKKGWIAEKHVVDLAKEIVDSNAHRVAGSGAGLDKNDVSIPSLNWELEVKNQKTIKIKEWWKQLNSQLSSGNQGAVVFHIPQTSQYLAVVDLEDFMHLLAGQQDTVTVSAIPNELKWSVNRLVEASKKVLKDLKEI